MDVVSVTDGKNLGKVCDLAFFFPENRLKGFFVTGSRGFKFSKADVFIPIADVTKIGEDVILVKQGNQGNPSKPQPPCPPPQRPCPPQQGQYPNQPPQRPCPPQQFPQSGSNNRRNYDEYE